MDRRQQTASTGAKPSKLSPQTGNTGGLGKSQGSRAYVSHEGRTGSQGASKANIINTSQNTVKRSDKSMPGHGAIVRDEDGLDVTPLSLLSLPKHLKIKEENFQSSSDMSSSVLGSSVVAGYVRVNL